MPQCRAWSGLVVTGSGQPGPPQPASSEAETAASAEAARHEQLIKAGQGLFHYQPIVNLRSGMGIGWEALVRLLENGRVVFPISFLPRLSTDFLREILLSAVRDGTALLR